MVAITGIPERAKIIRDTTAFSGLSGVICPAFGTLSPLNAVATSEGEARNRAIIVRRLLGLEDALSMGVTGPTHDARSWTFDLDPGGRDPVLGIERLQEAYFARFPGYDGGITVPAIVDIATGQVVTNDHSQITLDLSTGWRSDHRPGAPDL